MAELSDIVRVDYIYDKKQIRKPKCWCNKTAFHFHVGKGKIFIVRNTNPCLTCKIGVIAKRLGCKTIGGVEAYTPNIDV